MSLSPIFVGELNPYGDRAAFALFDEPAHSAGGRLRRKILGVRPHTYRMCERHNLCTGTWNRERARARASALLNESAGRVLVLLGRKVAEAFGLSDQPAFSARQLIGGPLCVVLPHPSGRNTVWNDPSAVERARAAIRSACPDFPVGEAEVEATCDFLTTEG